MRRTLLDIATPDGVADAYLTRPDEGDRHPGVLLLLDAFGLRPQIEAMADHIAARGYAVLAPNLFYRSGRAPVLPFPDLTDPGRRDAFMGEIAPLMAAITPEAITADAQAYLAALGTVADGPFGITGYCLGARLGLRIAGALPDQVAALGGFHGGRLVTDGPDSPHHAAATVRAEVYLAYADQDGSAPPEAIATVDAALAAAGVTHTTEVYPGAHHGYTMADTPAYDEAATARHWDALFALLGRTLAA